MANEYNPNSHFTNPNNETETSESNTQSTSTPIKPEIVADFRFKADFKSSDRFEKIEVYLNSIFGDHGLMPKISQNIKDTLVKIFPWLVTLLLALTIPAILASFAVIFGLTSFSPVGTFATYNFSVTYVLSAILSLVILVFQALSLPGLFKKRQDGWRWAFYGSLISVVQDIITLSFFSLIIGSAVSWYLLFQLKSQYK